MKPSEKFVKDFFTPKEQEKEKLYKEKLNEYKED